MEEKGKLEEKFLELFRIYMPKGYKLADKDGLLANIYKTGFLGIKKERVGYCIFSDEKDEIEFSIQLYCPESEIEQKVKEFAEKYKQETNNSVMLGIFPESIEEIFRKQVKETKEIYEANKH